MTDIVFMGSPDFAAESLKQLIQNETIAVKLVITQKDKKRNRNKWSPTPVKELALHYQIPVITPDDVNTQEVFEKIQLAEPDFLVVVAYGQLIKKQLLEAYPNRILNIHASLLPKYRGASPINAAIMHGEKETGISIMLVEKGLDAGDVLLQEKIPIAKDEFCSSLHDRLMKLGASSIQKVLKDYDKYFFERKKQDETQSSYAPLLTREMGAIDFSQDMNTIDQKFRGMYPWPGAYFYKEDIKIKVHDMKISDLPSGNEADGTVVDVNETGIYVKVGDGVIIFQSIQVPGKRKMSVADYLKGNHFEKNIILRSKI